MAAIKVELSKKRAWKEFGERLDDDLKIANKVFRQTIRVREERFACVKTICVKKDLNSQS